MSQKKKLRNYLLVMVMAAFVLGGVLQIATASKNPEIAKTSEPTKVQMVTLNFSELAEAVSPAVVNVRVEKRVKNVGMPFGHPENSPFGGDERFKDFFEPFFRGNRQPDFKQQGIGSGFIINKEGYIVTNNHVIDGADKIKVILENEKEFDAEVVGRDPQTDLAVIKVKGKHNFPTVRLGSSKDLKVGEWVVAIGNPFGLDHTVTAGIVSAKGRVVGTGPYDDFIQTDASINPGNSGGPLLNLKGEVVGINTMIIAGGQGIGFAIPIDQAQGIVKQLKGEGEVTRGWLGVTIQTLKGDLVEYYGLKDEKGVLVVDVVPGDPADKAGIQPKDIIMDVDGKKVETSRDLTAMVANLGVGERAKVTVLRNGEKKSVDVEIGKRPMTVASAGNVKPQEEKEGELGIKVTELTPELARGYNVPGDKGVIVVGVTPDGKGEKAGIQGGDVIIEVNRKPVTSVDDLKESIEVVKKGDVISLLIDRKDASLIVIKLTK